MPAADRARTASAAALKLGLGSGHFLRDGGKGQARGGMSVAEAAAAVALASDAGVRLIDTSARWGEAENMLGEVLPLSPPAPPPFQIVTKTVSLSLGLARVEAAARASLVRLRVPSASALLVPSAGDLLRPEGALLWRLLQKLKGEGLFDRIGIGAGPADDPLGLQARFKPDLMQLPASLLDQRLIADGTLERLAELGVEVQLRSVFQKGLLFRSRAELPPAATALGPSLSRIQRAIAEAGGDLLHAALSFALLRPEVSYVIVGVASASELKAVLAAASAPPPRLDWKALAFDRAGLGALSALAAA